MFSRIFVQLKCKRNLTKKVIITNSFNGFITIRSPPKSRFSMRYILGWKTHFLTILISVHHTPTTLMPHYLAEYDGVWSECGHTPDLHEIVTTLTAIVWWAL